MKKLGLIIICIGLVLSGCGSKEVAERSFFLMDTSMKVEAAGASEELLVEVEDLVFDLEKTLSVTDEESEVYEINQNGGGEVSTATEELLRQSIEISDKTNGDFDPTIYPIISKWGFTTGEYKVPTDEEIDSLLPLVSYKNISLNDDFVKLGEGMEVDFGGVGKGYAADKSAELLKENGIESAILTYGGNIHLIGSKGNGDPWNIGIKDPQSDSVLGSLQVTDRAVVTSGGYERFFEGENGETYWHIMDPKTGYPAKNELLSVTIVADSSTYADALSTALFVMGLEEAIEFWKNYEDFQTILVTEDKVYITEGIEKDFQLMEEALGYVVEVI